KSTVIMESISKKYEDIKRVLDEDMKVTLNQLEMEAQAAIYTLDVLIEKCNLATADIERELSELSDQLEQKTSQAMEPINIGNLDSIQLDGYKSDQLLQLINNLFVCVRSQIPVTKKVYQSYASTAVLDPDTAHPKLCVSADGTTATFTDEWQDVPNNPVRFDTTLNVISSEGFSDGRHYLELEVGGKTYWELGLTYPSIPRKGREETCWLGRGEDSWCVEFFEGDYTAWHNGVSHQLPISQSYNRIGVYLSYPAGLISFHAVDDLTQIVAFCAGTFTDTLHLAVCPGHDNEETNRTPVKIC
ncbi:TRI39 ligase, partial [Amia calva]|nr:TRI39 ligase [Amia calva]